MSGILLSGMYGVAGLCIYAALHHGSFGVRRPMSRTHVSFALISLTIAAYVVAKALSYQAATAAELVQMRRVDVAIAAIFYVQLPWFVAYYTRQRSFVIPVVLSAFFIFIFAANLWLPYGLTFVREPALLHLQLPWGERIVHISAGERTGLHKFAWLGILLVFCYALWACRRPYRSGERERALSLAVGISLFALLVAGNQLVNVGLVNSFHTAEFGFVALAIAVNSELIREQRRNSWHLQAILDHVPSIVYAKDRDGRYITSNSRHSDFLGMSERAVIGRTDHDLFPKQRADEFTANDRQVLRTGQPLQFEESLTRDGILRTYVSLKFPLLLPDGTPYAICGMSTDVTELRQTERERDFLRQQAWHADRVERTGVLAASLAHELSQPLAAILTNAQAGLRFLDRDHSDWGEVEEILRDIVRDEKRANSVINGLRDMIRRQDSPRERIDLQKSAKEVLDLLHSELLNRHIRTEFAVSGPSWIVANKAQIQQVLINLIMNASDAMADIPPAERLLVVSLESGDAHIRLAVRDYGHGIPEEHLDRVFDEFYSTKTGGLGMGLAVCRSIVEAHKGRIWVERNPDRGVTFALDLPLIAELNR